MGLAVCFTCASGQHDPGSEMVAPRASQGLVSIPLNLISQCDHENGLQSCPKCSSPLAGEGGGLLTAGFMLARTLPPDRTVN